MIYYIFIYIIKKRKKMILSEGYLRKIIKESIINLLNEEDNPAYDRRNAKAENLKHLWSVIDEKQKELYDYVYGELSEKLYDITEEKAKIMTKNMGNGYDFKVIPDKICDAGNAKLPPNVLVINMSSSLMCPSYYLGVCTIENCTCYAQKDENRFTRTDQESMLTNRWKSDLMHTQMLQQYQAGNKTPMEKYFKIVETYIQLGNAYASNLFKEDLSDLEYTLGRPLNSVEYKLLKVKHDKYKITDVRLNETGDFHCQTAVKLWNNFALKIKKKYGIKTHAYTARHLDFSDVSKNIAINASNKGVNLGEDIKPRHFIAVSDAKYAKIPEIKLGEQSQPILNKKFDNKYFYKCPCGDDETKCDRCGVCFNPNLTGKEYTIFVKYHGLKNAKGFKHLFTDSEISGVMEKLYQNGWVTDEEYKSYKSNGNQKRLKDTSTVISQYRSKDKPKTPKKAKNKK